MRVITTASRRRNGSGLGPRADASRPTAARVSSTAPTGTTHEVRVDRYKLTRPVRYKNQNIAAQADRTSPPATRDWLQTGPPAGRLGRLGPCLDPDAEVHPEITVTHIVRFRRLRALR